MQAESIVRHKRVCVCVNDPGPQCVFRFGPFVFCFIVFEMHIKCVLCALSPQMVLTHILLTVFQISEPKALFGLMAPKQFYCQLMYAALRLRSNEPIYDHEQARPI